MLILAKDWIDYKIIDAGNGEKLEQWGNIILRRPDPQIIWQTDKTQKVWRDVHAFYHRSEKGGGEWEIKKKFPEKWIIRYKKLAFHIKPTGFKHTGLFPEQAANWDWIIQKIQNAGRPIKVLNLFAYTGGATCAASFAGAAEVVHVDASKGMVAWAKENAQASGLSNNRIRYIVDDVFKFVEREYRRGNYYDAIIMDPPSYGRGPKGEIWKLENELPKLLELTSKILSDDMLFLLVNAYTTGFSHVSLNNMMKKIFGNKHQFISGEIGIPIGESELVLPCGIYARMEKK